MTVFIDSIEDLRHSDFVKCHVNSDYKLLVVSGEPTLEELSLAWFNIFSQHQKALDSAETKVYVRNVSKAEALNEKNHIVEHLVYILRLRYSPVIAGELKEWGYKYPFTPDSLENDLTRVMNEVANDKLKLAIIQKTLEKQQGKERKVTAHDYRRMLLDINKNEGIIYKATEISDADFCTMYVRLKEHIDYLKSKK